MRFGTIGTNFISREFVAAGEKVQGFSLAVVYSREMETARAFADRFGGAACVTDLNELAARTDVDAVYIASPNLFHKPQAEQMLRAGKHVLLEKPACSNRDDFAELCAVAKECGVVLLEAMRPAFIPGFLALREALVDIGPVRRVSFSYCQYSSRYDAYKQGIVENAFNPALCNGALMDIGVYCVHALVALFGLPERVQAMVQKLDNGLDAQGGAQCIYPGMLAELSWSKIADHRRMNEIQGERGTLLIDSISNPRRIVRVGRDKVETVIYHEPDPEFFAMHHEIAAFMAFASGECGADAWVPYNRVTEDSLRLMDEIRRQTGIDFKPQNSRKGERQ